MSWLTKLFPSRISTEARERKTGVPEGVWAKCPSCQAVIYGAELTRNQDVCSKCEYHIRITARKRLDYFLDAAPRVELAVKVEATDRLKFKDTKKYKDRLSAAQKQTQEKDALVVFHGAVENVPVVVSAFEFQFIGGSMGAAVGERFVIGVNAALEARCPFICFTTSGGARMQEGVLSLLQMAKTSAALGRLKEARLPYIVVLTDPTYGGVSASLAMLGDITIAEPKAMIGFAGPRVIEQTVRETLPEGFQQSEFLLSHGFVDMIVDRRSLRKTVSRLLTKLMSSQMA